MTEPTEAARAIRIEAIKRRATDERNTSAAALDRRWLLGEVERLTRERDDLADEIRVQAELDEMDEDER